MTSTSSGGTFKVDIHDLDKALSHYVGLTSVHPTGIPFRDFTTIISTVSDHD